MSQLSDMVLSFHKPRSGDLEQVEACASSVRRVHVELRFPCYRSEYGPTERHAL